MPTIDVLMPILINHSWQWLMTKHAIELLTGLGGPSFRLIIVETAGEFKGHTVIPDRPRFVGDTGEPVIKKWLRESVFQDTLYHYIPTKSSPNADCNTGLDLCSADFVVYTGNDIFVRQGWLEALLEPFDKLRDCGASTLSSGDLHRNIPPHDRIFEGVYGPFMMFRRLDREGNPWKYDAGTFPSQFGDTDLIMRMYGQGYRMYRNWKVRIEHLNVQTHDQKVNAEDFQSAKARFIEKHKNSPYLMFQILASGQIV